MSISFGIKVGPKAFHSMYKRVEVFTNDPEEKYTTFNIEKDVGHDYMITYFPQQDKVMVYVDGKTIYIIKDVRRIETEKL